MNIINTKNSVTKPMDKINRDTPYCGSESLPRVGHGRYNKAENTSQARHDILNYGTRREQQQYY